MLVVFVSVAAKAFGSGAYSATLSLSLVAPVGDVLSCCNGLLGVLVLPVDDLG